MLQRSVAIGLSLLGLILHAVFLNGTDLYVIRMESGARFAGLPCLFVSWRDEIRFYNASDQAKLVTLVGVSNGETRPSPASVTVPPGTLASTLGTGGPGDSWRPVASPSLWVAHLDVPTGVAVDSQGEAIQRGTGPSSCLPTTTEFVHGSFPLPQFTSLVPAGKTQVHLVADLGTQEARINLGIYNAGSVPAHVSVDVRRSCNNSLLAHRDVMVAANSIEQVAGIPVLDPFGCFGSGTAPDYAAHVVLVSDQPGFSYVTPLANLLPPVMPLSMSR